MPLDPARALLLIEQAREVLSDALEQLQPDQPADAVHLTPQQQAIVKAATGYPASTRTLARIAKCAHNPHFRENVRILTDLGYLVRSSRGYRLAYYR